MHAVGGILMMRKEGYGCAMRDAEQFVLREYLGGYVGGRHEGGG